MMGWHGMAQPAWAAAAASKPRHGKRRAGGKGKDDGGCDSDCSCDDCCICEEAPGPGHYNIPSCFASGPAFTIRPKTKNVFEAKEELPGGWRSGGA